MFVRGFPQPEEERGRVFHAVAFAPAYLRRHFLFQSVHALSFHSVDLCYFKIEKMEIEKMDHAWTSWSLICSK